MYLQPGGEAVAEGIYSASGHGLAVQDTISPFLTIREVYFVGQSQFVQELQEHRK